MSMSDSETPKICYHLSKNCTLQVQHEHLMTKVVSFWSYVFEVSRAISRYAKT